MDAMSTNNIMDITTTNNAIPVNYNEAKKENRWITVIFITIIIIIIVAIIILIVLGTVSSQTFNANQQRLNNLPTCNSISNELDLIKIPNDFVSCQNSTYYIGKLSNGLFDFEVAPWGSTNHDVCVQFCTTFDSVTQICNGVPYQGKSANVNYHSCLVQLDILNSGSCTGPLPIASKGPILYYPLSPSCKRCTTCD